MKYPLIPVAIAFALGILAADIAPLSFSQFILLTVAFISLSLIFYRRRPELVSIPLLAVSFTLGAARAELAEGSLPSPLFNDHFIRGIQIHGRAVSCELPAGGKLNFAVVLDSVTSGGRKWVTEKKLLVSFYNDSGDIYQRIKNLQPGAVVSLTGNYYRLRTEANPYAFDEESYYQQKGFSGRFRVTKPDSSLTGEGSGFVYERMVHQVRRGTDSLLYSLFSPEVYALLRGLLLADRGEIDYETQKQFSNAGVIHILAVSGLHMGFIAFLFSLFFTRLGRVNRDIGTILGVLLFLALTGFVTTATRAGIMIILFLAGRLMQRDPYPVHTVFAAALLILLWNPFDIYSAGFQLSFSAVFGILFFMKPLEDLVRVQSFKSSFLSSAVRLMLVSVSALIGIFPFLLYHFGVVSLISPVSNLIVIPLSALILSGGLMAMFFSLLPGGLAIYMAASAEFLYMILSKTVSFFAAADFMLWRAEGISPQLIVLLGALAGLLYYWLRAEGFRKAVRILLSGSTLILIFLVSRAGDGIFEKGKLDVLFLDVGQGDAVLVSTPAGETWLIDGGVLNPFSDAGRRRILPFLERAGISRVDYALISHYDSDHYGGIAVLLKEGMIGTLILPDNELGEGADDVIETLARINNTQVIFAADTLIHSGGVAFYLLLPAGDLPQDEKRSNERSISLKLVYGKTAFLFTGDAPIVTERNLITKFGSFLNADILKAGHHGSRSSTGEDLLSIVKPDYVVFSSGLGNRYNHPAQEVIHRAAEYGARLARTDYDGAQLFTSDGISVQKRLWK